MKTGKKIYVSSKKMDKYSKTVHRDNFKYYKTFQLNEKNLKVLEDYTKKLRSYKNYLNANGYQFDFTVNADNVVEMEQDIVTGEDFKGDFFDWLPLYKNFIIEVQKFRPVGLYLRASDLQYKNLKFVNGGKKFILIDETKLNTSNFINKAKYEFIYGAFSYLTAQITKFPYNNVSPQYISQKIIDNVEEAFYEAG